MTVRHPDTVLLDLRAPIAEYEKSVKHLSNQLDTDPGSMVSWLSCYIPSRDGGDMELWNAVADIESSCYDMKLEPADIECFSEAADQMGEALLNLFERHGLYTRGDGKIPYRFHGLVAGKSAIFKRNGQG